MATVLARICCYQNSLPQGAPTSPIVSNMICAKLDSRLHSLANLNKLTYTRYADDITFSTTKRVFPKSVGLTDPVSNQISVGAELKTAIEENGFGINEGKVRLQRRDGRQRVTGLTVNQKPNVKKALINQVRAMLHSWESVGLAAAETAFHSKWDQKSRRKPNPDFKKVLKGKIDFIGFVKGKDSSVHARFYWDYCKLDRKFPFKSIVATNSASDLVIRETLWVFESEYGEQKQGTGVYIDSLGIVTCRHVLEKYTEAFHWREPNRKFGTAEMIRLWESEEHDLVVLSIGAKPRAQLGVDRSGSWQRGDAVTVYGFPDYHEKQSPVVIPGYVTGDRERIKTQEILVSSLIVAGNSGGPVLDSQNRLIGIASRGPADNAENADKTMNAVTSILHLPLHLPGS